MKSADRLVVYYRVSTARQGKSGLGLDAQRAAVSAYLNGRLSGIIAEFTEVESGKRADRPELEKALAEARLHRCPLVVSKVDRLTRSVAFLSRLLEAGVDVRFADLPQIEGATGRFILQQMVAVAELEAGLISARTKAALKAAKSRGVILGGNRGTYPSKRARDLARTTVKKRASLWASDIAATIADLKQTGCVSLRDYARALNAKGVPTARGHGEWSAVQVSRLMALLADQRDKRA